MSERTTAPDNDTKPSRLRGSLLALAKDIEPQAEYGALMAYEHSPTWGLELSDEPTTVGDLHKDGYQAWNTNHVSAQDAFAISRGRTRFAVADGMGGYGADKLGTRFFAKFMSDYVVQHGIDGVFDTETLTSLCHQAEEEFVAVAGRRFDRPRMSGSMIGTVGSTLTFVEVLSPERTRVVTIGDSPAFLMDENDLCLAQYGEDAQSGSVDSPVAHKLGIDSAGQPITPEREPSSADGRRIVDQIIDVPSSGMILIGTDYFSESPPLAVLGDSLPTAEEFRDRVLSRGKSDDATLIAIKPSQLPH